MTQKLVRLVDLFIKRGFMIGVGLVRNGVLQQGYEAARKLEGPMYGRLFGERN
jgi:hypothetical protein